MRVVDVHEGEVKRILKPDHNGEKSISAIAVVQLRRQKKDTAESAGENDDYECLCDLHRSPLLMNCVVIQA